MREIKGLHHVTAISGPAQENLDFYLGVLGLRLVKKSVNQDDPGTYHLFYADAEGHPGTDLTFFPWAQMAPSRDGYGLSSEVSLAVPPGSLSFWSQRLERYGVRMSAAEVRFGQDALPVTDPHGLHLALVESEDSLGRAFTPWDGSPIPVEHQIRGLESARLVERDLVVTTSFLSNAMGFTHLGTENGWHRYGGAPRRDVPARPGLAACPSGQYVDLRETPTARRGAWGTGSVHHIAWRVDDEAHQLEVRERVTKTARNRRRSSIAFGSNPSISENQAAFFLNWPPTAQVSPLTKIARISAKRSCCRRGWNQIALRSRASYRN